MKLKPFITCLIATASLLQAHASDSYTLDVEFKNIPDSVKFTLGSDNDDKYKQKVSTSGNRLHFDLDITEDYPVRLYLIGKNPADQKDRFYVLFYGAKGINHKITSHLDGFSADSISYAGAPWDGQKMQIQNFQRVNHRLTSEISGRRHKLFDSASNGNRDEPITLDSVSRIEAEALWKQIDRLQNEYKDYTDKFIIDNPDSPDALSFIGWRYPNLSRSDLESFAARVPANLKESPEYSVLRKILDLKIISLGDKLSDYELTGENVEGTPVNISQFTSPYIIVEFSSLGCGACRMAAKKELPDFLKKHADKVTFVSFSVDEDRKSMEKAHRLDNATWQTIWDGKGASGETCLKYGVTGYPSFFVFGPGRTLLHTWSGWGPGYIEYNFSKVVKE
ncbi:MAG: TlpA family protein disulfide reductase [Bacteroides sp.]|nr:TlpA family protein disulfide reductase [Bacteroides sp.]